MGLFIGLSLGCVPILEVIVMKKVVCVESSPIVNIQQGCLLYSIKQALAMDLEGEETVYAVVPAVDEGGWIDNLVNGLMAAAVLRARSEGRRLNEKTIAWMNDREFKDCWYDYVWWVDETFDYPGHLVSARIKASEIRAELKHFEEMTKAEKEKFFGFHPEDENDPYYDDYFYWLNWEPSSTSAIRIRSLIIYSLVLYADGRMNLDRFCETVGRLVSMAA